MKEWAPVNFINCKLMKTLHNAITASDVALLMTDKTRMTDIWTPYELDLGKVLII